LELQHEAGFDPEHIEKTVMQMLKAVKHA
jgi:hypothetical protein